MRLHHEHNLYLYQFVLIGAVFSILIGTSGLLQNRQSDRCDIFERLYESGSLFSTLGVIAIALVIVDIHIRYNALMMEALGNWIRDHYEKGLLFPVCLEGWESFWRGERNKIFNPGASFLYMMLYLPTIVVLLGFYTMLVCQTARHNKIFVSLKRIVFVGVQISVILFVATNNWPLTRMSLNGWCIAILWLVLFVLISLWSFFWLGCK
jgi:hypothetical protein